MRAGVQMGQPEDKLKEELSPEEDKEEDLFIFYKRKRQQQRNHFSRRLEKEHNKRRMGIFFKEKGYVRKNGNSEEEGFIEPF